ncbi:phenylacetate--CoA ligase family protein [Streptomyces sp. NPDC088147]|uniref:phenylacetate--CoA ligase family protein n=1 Tax=Streptomyces sp. NPDC088147 TaxID=3365830 RepID=UPI00382F19A0
MTLRMEVGAPKAPSPDDEQHASYYTSLLDIEERWDGDPSSEVLRAWRGQRTAEVTDWVRARSPFYAERLGREREAAGGTFFTTKDDLVTAGLSVLSGPVGEAQVYYETTGTTGPPTPCPRSSLEVAASNRGIIRAWQEMLARRFPGERPFVAVMGPSELYAFGDVFGNVAQSCGLGHVKLWPDSPRVGFAKALRLLRQLAVSVVVCAPSMVLELAREVLRAGHDPADLPVSQFLVLGEVCTPEFRRNAETLWPQARVGPGMYGSQEAMCIAGGWPDGRLRLSELNYSAELVDPGTGEPVTGDTGELVVTMLTPGVKPLIRYRTGDLVRFDPWTPGDLPGRALTVLGRAKDDVRFADGRSVTAYDLEEAALEGLERCLGYQIVLDHRATAAGPPADLLTLRLRFADPAPGRDHWAAAAGRMTALTGAEVRVEVVDDLDARTQQGSLISWKAARVADRRPGPVRAP